MAIQIALRFALRLMGDGETATLGVPLGERTPVEIEMPHGTRCWLASLGALPRAIAADVIANGAGAKIKAVALTDQGLALEFEAPWKGETMVTGTFLF
jgi:hypothetical protein